MRGGKRRGAGCVRLEGKRVNDLAGPGIVQLLTGLVLDGVGIALQAAGMVPKLLVLVAQSLKLRVEAARLFPLLLVRDEPILAEDDMIAKRYGKQGSGGRRDLAPDTVDRPNAAAGITNRASTQNGWIGMTHRISTRGLPRVRQAKTSDLMGVNHVSTPLPPSLEMLAGSTTSRTKLSALIFLDTPMNVLLALSVASFCALLWASFSIARHVRAGGDAASVAADPVASGTRERSVRYPMYEDLNSPSFAHRQRQRPSRGHAGQDKPTA